MTTTQCAHHWIIETATGVASRLRMKANGLSVQGLQMLLHQQAVWTAAARISQSPAMWRPSSDAAACPVETSDPGF